MRKGVSYLLTVCIVLSLGVTSFAESEPAVLKPGDIIEFGFYEQDNIAGNGPEPIEWIVLDVQEERALLVSKYGLDCKPYIEEVESTRWDSCTLREWLGDSFFTTAFSENQQEAIILSEVDNSAAQAGRHFQYVLAKGTKDKVFLLSGAEVEQYYKLLTKAEPTPYALKRGAVLTGSNYYSWLRGVTRDEFYVDTWKAIVYAQVCFGRDTSYAIPVDTKGILVRPAMWMNLNKLPDALDDMESEKENIAAGNFIEAPSDEVTYDFLIGYWSSRNGMHTFEMKKDHGYITTVPVVPRSGDTYDLIDGVIYKYFANSPGNKTANLKFTKISETEIEVYSYQTKTSYTLIKRR